MVDCFSKMGRNKIKSAPELNYIMYCFLPDTHLKNKLKNLVHFTT